MVQTWPYNFIRNLKALTIDVSAQRWLKIGLIVAVYIIIRPLLVKFGAWTRGTDLEEPSKARNNAKMSPNAFRGQVIDEESEEEEEQAVAASGVDSTKKAKKRQRQAEKAAEKLRLQEEEDEEDRKLDEFLMRNANYVGNPNPHNLTLDD